MPLTPDMIMEAALAISGDQARSAYLDEVCAGDVALRDEVDSLIAAYREDDRFMSAPVHTLWQEMRREGVGDTIGRYQLLALLGEGGFGTVFLAEQRQPVRRKVALKVIKPGMDSQEIIARFEAERQALALMDHPHIAKVHDAGTTDAGRPYFVMELVEGIPITDYCTEHSLVLRSRLELFVDVCTAVQHAHQKGIIHRDLKPSNILATHHDGEAAVKVIDFGIAKAIGMELTENTIFTQQDRMIGTPQYMSPEQAERNLRAVDTRSDIFSLGAVLYELLTGRTPLDVRQLRDATYGEMQRIIREDMPAKPSSCGDESSLIAPRALRGDLDGIVLKALEKEPSRRYESAGAFAEDVMRYLQFKPVKARPPSMPYLMLRFARRYRGAVAAGVALLIALVLGAVGTSMGMKRALDAKQQLELNNAELIDAKERLAGLLESNQNMLDEISRMNTSAASLPREFEALRKENQELLGKVSSEVANQERYAEQISRLKESQEDLEKNLTQQRIDHAELVREKNKVLSRLGGLQKAIAMMHANMVLDEAATTKFSDRIPVDLQTSEVKVPHTVVTLTPDQVDETQTLGTLTLNDEQWRGVRSKYPSSPKRFPHVLSLSSPDRLYGPDADYAIELSRDRMALLHRSDLPASHDDIRRELFQQPITSLRANERGEFYLRGKLVPFPALLKALESPPEKALRDEDGKLLITAVASGTSSTAPRWLGVKLPAEARPSDPVYLARLSQLAAAADQIGLRHALFME
jgi:serine/threonine protein kinase